MGRDIRRIGHGPGGGLAIEPVKVFLLLTTAVTIGGVVAGTFLSTLWFIRVLRRCGLCVRFTPGSAIGGA